LFDLDRRAPANAKWCQLATKEPGAWRGLWADDSPAWRREVLHDLQQARAEGSTHLQRRLRVG
jgi:hypothetical protein